MDISSSTQTPPLPAPAPRRRWLRVTLLAALAVLLAYGLAAAVAAFVAYASLNAAKTSAQAAGAYAEQLDLPRLSEAADDTAASLRRSRRSLLVLYPARIVPAAGRRLAGADRVLASSADAVESLADAVRPLADALQLIRQQEGIAALPSADPTASLRDLTPDQKRSMLAALHEAAPHIAEAVPRIDAALASLDAAPLEDIGPPLNVSLAPVRQSIDQAKEKLMGLRKTLAAVAPFAELLPATLGYQEPRHYLLFLANNTELRPSGGFLGLVGVATVADAELARFEMRDVYAYDGAALGQPRPAPPAPLQKYLGVSQWFLRDANWSPDFSESAKQMAAFYDQESAFFPEGRLPRVDGIIQFDPEPVADLLRLTGPITVDGKTFTAENLVDQLEFEVELAFYFKEDFVYDDRKAIVGLLADQLVARLQQLPLSQLADVFAIVEANFAEGHIALWSPEQQLQSLFAGRDWAGIMKPVSVDYLSVIDANLASLKTDPAVERSIRYAIRPDGDGFIATASIEYDHRGSFDWKTTRYRTYARVYAPAGSQLIAVRGSLEDDKLKNPGRRPGASDTFQELGRTAFGAFVAIEPGKKETLEFEYRLPPSVAAAIRAGSYRLDAEKQLGTFAHSLTLDLNFGKNVRTAVPAEPQAEWGNATYRLGTDLRVDRSFQIGL